MVMLTAAGTAALTAATGDNKYSIAASIVARCRSPYHCKWGRAQERVKHALLFGIVQSRASTGQAQEKWQ